MLVCSMTQELIANLLRVHRKGITSLPVTCTHLYVCLRTDPLSFDCYNSSASFRNYVSTSGIGSATFFLSRLVILQRGRRSCSLSVRSHPSIRLRILRCNLCIPAHAWKPLVQALETEKEKCRF